MDWNKTKSIFIFVFLILNIFLYSQYLGSKNEEKKLEVIGETTKIEAQLKEENISYIALPNNVESASYLSGKVKQFTKAEVPTIGNPNILIENETKLYATYPTPVKLPTGSGSERFLPFMQNYVDEGASYTLWQVNEEERYAIFFQRVNDRTLYYNVGAVVKLYWNTDGDVYGYEQTMLEKTEELEQKETILSPIQVIQILYSKNLLKPDSRISSMKLGYSTLVQLTQTQVFAPTWEVHVKTKDNNEEQYFVNAVEGKVIDIEQGFVEINDVDE